MHCPGFSVAAARRGRGLAGVVVVLFAGGVSHAWPQAGSPFPPAEHEGKLIHRDAASTDEFGRSVAISGDTAIVGAPLKNAAYVFVRDRPNVHAWHEVAKISQPCPEYQQDGVTCRVGFAFGISVAIDGDLAIVGALADDPGLQHRAFGAAYIYARHAGGHNRWGQVAKLTAADPVANAELGQSVSIDGDTAVVGAWTPHDQGQRAASAYVFSWKHGVPGAWRQVAKLTAGAAATSSPDKVAVSLSGNTAVIGNPQAGAAFLFSRQPVKPDTWREVAALMPGDASPGCGQGRCRAFGIAVSISSDTVVVGAPSLNDGEGAAYVFRHDDHAHRWREAARLKSRDTEAPTQFGISVNVDGGFAIIGALSDAAYVFEREPIDQDIWRERARLAPADGTGSSNWFGYSVSLSGDTGIVGALLDADHGPLSGAAYACRITGPIPDSVACRRQDIATGDARTGPADGQQSVGNDTRRTKAHFYRAHSWWRHRPRIDSSRLTDELATDTASRRRPRVTGHALRGSESDIAGVEDERDGQAEWLSALDPIEQELLPKYQRAIRLCEDRDGQRPVRQSGRLCRTARSRSGVRPSSSAGPR